MQSILSETFPNGLTLLAEPMPWLESAAFALLIPGGSARDPASKQGLANLLCDMVQRGCGVRDSRQFLNDLEFLGMDHSASVSLLYTLYGGATVAENIYRVLPIFADMVISPHLPEAQLEDSRQVCFQELRAYEDDLARRMMANLRQLRYGDPYGRVACGSEEAVASITLNDVRGHFEQTYGSTGAILSVAGKVDWAQLRDCVADAFADWWERPLPPVSEAPCEEIYRHVQVDSAQTHIGVAYPVVPYDDPDYYLARGAVGVLSDGMSSRLFTKVREERGLCYTVDASYHALQHRASTLCYAGTTTDRAQETLDVMLAELRELPAGVTESELERLKARFKSGLLMQQESSSSRSTTMAAQWYFLGRVKTLDEVSAIIDDLTCARINRYLAANPPCDFRYATLGAKQLELPVGVS